MEYIIVGLALIFILLIKGFVFICLWAFIHSLRRPVTTTHRTTMNNTSNIYYDTKIRMWCNRSTGRCSFDRDLLEAPTQMKLFDPTETR